MGGVISSLNVQRKNAKPLIPVVVYFDQLLGAAVYENVQSS